MSEVARLLHVSRGTVYYMIRGGDLPSVRIHGMLRLPERGVLNHLRLHARRLQKPRARRRQAAIAHPGAPPDDRL